jgi:hypothetical protein
MLTITDAVALARRIMQTTDEATLSARYSDWYDWEDFLNGKSSHHPDPVAYLEATPREAAAFFRFLARIQGN